MNMRRFVILAISLAFAAPAAADVTVKSKMKSGGFKGMGAFEGTSVRSVAGQKSRETSDIKYSGRLMRMMAGAKDAVTITRVDLDKIFHLVPSKKTYTESSISAHLNDMKRGRAEAEKPSGEAPAKEEKPTHRIKKTNFTVAKSGDKKTVNGFSTEEHELRLTVEVEELSTKHVTTFKSETDVWVTPWTPALRGAMDEETKFAQAYMNKLGVKISPKDRQVFNPALLAMMLGVSEANAEETLAQTKKKLETIQGYPIVTDARWYVEEDPKLVAARKEGAAKKEAEEEEAGIDFSGGAQGVAGGLLGGFAKKKMKEKRVAREKARESLPAFSTYYEVTAVETAAVPASEFEVPAGFKKIGN